jgi:uncharacterized membrane protein
VGVAINEIGKLLVANPLSLNMLILSINSLLLAAAFIGNRHADLSSTQTPQSRLSSRLSFAVLFISLLLLGSYGIFIVSYTGSNLFILILIIVVSAIVPLALVREKNISSNLFPLLLLLVFLCTLLFVSESYSLVTPYITGNGDQWFEYYVFRLTGNSWNSMLSFNSPYYSMMSITILPEIFSVITAMDSSFLFKLLYPVVAAFVGIGAYRLYQTQTDNKTAFLATFFLITVSIAKGMGPARQQIAELFYVLLLLILIRKDFSPFKKNVLLIVFGAALVLSHYSLTYIFLFTIISVFMISFLSDYIKTGHAKLSQTKIPLSFVIIFSVLTFSWYVYVNGSAAFNPLIQTANTVMRNLNQFFNLGSRGTALAGLGIVETPSIYYSISGALFILTEILLVVGFIAIFAFRKYIPSKFSYEYKIFATLDFAIIVINLLIPRIADTFLMSRFYQVTLVILAPLAIIGAKAILEFMLKRRFQKYYTAAIALLLFVPFFFFQTNFVYEVTGDKSYNFTLSLYRWDIISVYENTASPQEVFGAQWIPQYSNLSRITVYSDQISYYHVLLSYGLTRGQYVYDLLGVTNVSSSAVTYISDVALITDGYLLNVTEVSSIIENQNKIYSNGQSEIYKGCAP